MLNVLHSEHENANASADALTIDKITLAHFRNYRDLALTLEPAPVLLTGANGSGKTNLLEAISLLVPGRGLRRAASHELQNQTEAQPWAVAARLMSPFGGIQIGTGRDPEELESERRVVHVDGRHMRSQHALSEHVVMAWITPDMDRLLAEGPSARRKWLDRLVFSFDPAHGGRVNRYEKALRERLRLLREGPADAVWMNALEDELAQTGIAIAAARKYMLRQLHAAIAETSSVFPQADLAIKGMAEEMLDQSPALVVEDKIRAALYSARAEDARSGTCATGPHRSDLAVTHREKNCPAELCSTGEQKALVVAIMLAYTRTLKDARHMVPLLLLDDIAAHLDDVRRSALFEEVQALGAQAWITGTDTDPFTSLLPFVQHAIVEHGTVQV